MNDQQSIWDKVSTSYIAYSQALKDFLAQDVDRIKIIKSALRGKDRYTAIHLLQYLNQSEQIELFSELVFLSSFSHGAVGTVRQIILSLPRDWVLNNIEQTAEPFLANGTYDEFRRLSELYLELDRELTLRLARRAAKNGDSDIREVGEDFLNKLELGIPPK